MKYKIYVLVICFCILFTAIIDPVQMLEYEKQTSSKFCLGKEYTPCTEDTEGEFCTHLPLLCIDTKEKEIPGTPILGDDKQIVGYEKSEENKNYIVAELSLMDREGNHHLTDTPDFKTLTQIGIRGNSSRLFDKKGYSLRFVNEDGSNHSHEVMGMDSHCEWILHGPFLDKTQLRNYFFYNLAGEIMDYAPNVRFCELFINENYEGIYLVVENITAGNNGARLGLSVNKKNDSLSGYILRLDRGNTDEAKNIHNLSEHFINSNSQFEIEYPGSSNLTEKIKNDIQQDYVSFEKMLYSYDFDDREYGYESRIDVLNFVDYFIINEISANYDSGIYSTYIYKLPDNKYRLCVWDFNNALNLYQEKEYESAYEFQLCKKIWFNQLFKSERFTELVIQRYRYLRKGILSEERLQGIIDDAICYLGPALDRNEARWGYSYLQDDLIGDNRNIRNYDQAIEQMIGFLFERLEWIDGHIDSLKQYSAESMTKKYKDDAN